MFSSALFAISILLIKTNKNLAFFIMGFSIIFGKLIQILLVIPFIFIYIMTVKKISFLNLFNFILPFLAYISLVSFKTEDFNLIDYFASYLEIIYNHQSSGLKVIEIFNLENFLLQLNNSEYSQWTLITKIRVLIAPIIFLIVMFIEREKFNKIVVSSYGIIFSILPAYIWFLIFSQTKWIRYSQHFLYLILFFSIIILFSETKLSSLPTLLLVLNISLFLSSEILLVLFLCSLFVKNNLFMFKKILLIILILNSLNLLIESHHLPIYNLNFESCKNNLSSMACVDDYLPYKFVND